MSHRITKAMDDLMPGIRAAFKTMRPQLADVLHVETRESALSVRMPRPEWPKIMDQLVEPAGQVEKALRISCETTLDPLEDADVLAEVEKFARETAEKYIASVLGRIDQVATAQTGNPTVDTLEKHALDNNLARPCQVIAGTDAYRTLQSIKSTILREEARLQNSIDSKRVILFSFSDRGPWAELLDPEFILDWKVTGDRKVTVTASQRLYFNNVRESACWTAP